MTMVRYGVYSQLAGLVGRTVRDVRTAYAAAMSIPAGAVAFKGKTALREDYVIADGDHIEFHTMPTDSRTVCSVCGADRYTEIKGVPFCSTHYLSEVATCGKGDVGHDWVLDSTEVFTVGLKQPVIRAVYFCVRCTASVVAKPGQEPGEAWRELSRRARTKLLNIERMLEE